MSSASETIASQLTTSDAPSLFYSKPECIASGVYAFFWCMIILLCISIFISLMSMMLPTTRPNKPHMYDDDTIYYQHPRMRRANCQMESFQNSIDPMTYQTYSYSKTSNHQSIPLTARNTPENTPENLTFGQATRHIIDKNGKAQIIFDIHANLYVLDGNILNQRNEQVQHFYKVSLVDTQGKEVSIGQMYRGGDGIYKLKFQSDNVEELSRHKNIVVVYVKNGEAYVMLQGTFY